MNQWKKILSYPVIFLIKLYQIAISPFFHSTCRYHPTCSNYALEAIETHGVFTGVRLALKRIAQCHPWGQYGCDPVPPKVEKQK